MSCRRLVPLRAPKPALAFWAASLLLLTGCADEGRLALEGAVTLDGQPLDKGFITFRPQPGTPGPTAGGPIEGGRFSIAPEQGAFAGTFRVEISAQRPTGKTLLDADTGQVVPHYEQGLPERYNRRSELAAEVKPGLRNHFEFALTSK
jgi:hypothetical protein